MYTAINFETKKALKAAVAGGVTVGVFQPGPFPAQRDGHITLEGPHFPAPHTWYAQADIKDGVIIQGTVR